MRKQKAQDTGGTRVLKTHEAQEHVRHKACEAPDYVWHEAFKA